MIYRVIGGMSGSSLDGLDLAFVEFEEQGGKWSFETKAAACFEYEGEWKDRLKNACSLSARDHALLDTAFGRYIGEKVLAFIQNHQLHYQVGLISSHGHTSFHIPEKNTTVQLGDGAAIAATTGLPVVTDLRSMDVALGGQGAPIVPVGEKYLLPGFQYFLNLGGIANISLINDGDPLAFDICPANRVLNLLASEKGLPFDEGGAMASSGVVNDALLAKLNELDYYQRSFPKSLANEFGTDIIYPLIKAHTSSVEDGLSTFTEHIAIQVSRAVSANGGPVQAGKMLITGGGAFNTCLVKRVTELLANQKIKVEVPDPLMVSFKEAIIMAFIGVLRWRQEANVLSRVTGSLRDSIGGSLWAGE